VGDIGTHHLNDHARNAQDKHCEVSRAGRFVSFADWSSPSWSSFRGKHETTFRHAAEPGGIDAIVARPGTLSVTAIPCGPFKHRSPRQSMLHPPRAISLPGLPHPTKTQGEAPLPISPAVPALVLTLQLFTLLIKILPSRARQGGAVVCQPILVPCWRYLASRFNHKGP